MSHELTAREAYWRFLVLTALRWLPVGLMIPVFVLLPLDRGLSIAQVGLAFALQGFVVLALELPTGGLADAVGRRRVLLLSTVLSVASIVIFALTESFAGLVGVALLQGVYRALDSGPLEAWYVDASLAADPHAPIDRGMSAYGTVVGVAMAAGAISGGALVGLSPGGAVNPLILPVYAALVLQTAGTVAILVLMVEHRPVSADSLWASVRRTPRTIAEGVALLRASHVLLALVLVELFWGFGMITFESLMPVRLAEVTGGREAAAVITGPAASAAWLASAAGAFGTAWLGRRVGLAPVAAAMRVLQGVTVVGLGLLGGVVGLVIAYLACYAVHGCSNAAHSTLLHREATGEVRATVVSLNSMVAQPAGSLGLIVLTGVAGEVSVSAAMYVGALVLALAAPLYLPAWRQERAAAA